MTMLNAHKTVRAFLRRSSAFALSLGLVGLLVGCAGASSSTDTTLSPVAPRPPYGAVNVTLVTAGVNTPHQLFLDYGSTQFPKKYPILVGNHQDNQTVTLWRYDFLEPTATDAASAIYGTLLVRVDNGATGYVSFFGRAGTWPVGVHTLDPASNFGGKLPETPQNKVPTACWLFLRQGTACVIPNPATIGRIGGYRTLSESTTVAVSIPGLDFPVGGVTLASSDATPVVSSVGNDGAVTQLPLDANGKPLSGISSPIQTVDTERVPTVTQVSPVTSQWDVCFAWQPPSLGVTLTHGFTADPTLVGGIYGTGQMSATGGGFFLTMEPGSPSLADGVNSLNWTVLRSTTNAVWALGWSADVTATGSVALGNNAGTFSTIAPGQGVISTQARGFLSGVMSPDAMATIFQGAQDKAFTQGSAMLVEATHIPMIARSKTATMSGQLGQLTVGGRTLWYRQNATIIGADVLASDQSLVQLYGSMVSFSSYLPVIKK